MTKMDPVCGMQVDENKAAATSTFKGEKYYFCSNECKERFDKEPSKYAKTEQFAGRDTR